MSDAIIILAIVGFFLGFASYLDLKFKAVPSVILTGLIFALLLLRPDNLIFGVASFVFAILIRDFIFDVGNTEFGIADIKVLTIIGLLINSVQNLFIMVIVFLIFQFVYTALWRWRIGDEEEIPFIPCLTAVYIVMVLIGGVA